MAERLDLATPIIPALLDRCRFPGRTGGVDHVDCAVSGGADSTALAALVVAAGFDATLIHVDHGLRPQSALEADHVADLSERLGCRFRAEHVRIEPGPDLEARARRARYSVVPYGVLTGHTLDDQAETILLNLIRGAGLDGLAGMDEASPHPRRPLLGLRRADTEQLCRTLGLRWLVDPTNADPAHRRNRVRHDLLPLLDAIAGRDVAPIVARQAHLLRDEAAVLDGLADAIDPTDARALAAAPPAVARRVMRRWLTSIDPEQHPPNAATVERCLAVARNEALATDVGGGRRLVRHRQRLAINALTPDPTSADQPVPPPVK